MVRSGVSFAMLLAEAAHASRRSEPPPHHSGQADASPRRALPAHDARQGARGLGRQWPPCVNRLDPAGPAAKSREMQLDEPSGLLSLCRMWIAYVDESG